MNTAQQSFNDQVKQFTDMQSKGFEPMRIFGGLAAEAMEQVARQNYAVMGDFVEFSVKQAKLPMSGENASDVMSAQMAEASAFSEKMNSRASEYAELANTLSERTRKAADDASSSLKKVTDEATSSMKKATDEAASSMKKAADNASSAAKKA